ncbi:MAG: hypothetical protein P1U74_08100 [Legionellaceae bacterium]|nr:hypothetical protein [Legionellaceae bacterium]
MAIDMHEPITARYIYVNPETNIVHLLLPIVGGVDISTDNTCKSALSLKTFFGKYASASKNKDSALNTLIRYKEALERDIAVLPDEHHAKNSKKDRLVQIKKYINVLNAIQNDHEFDGLYKSDPKYPKSIASVIQTSGNLYSMILRPGVGLDTHTHTVKPTFSVKRGIDQEVFYKELKNTFDSLNIDSSSSLLNKARKRIISSFNTNKISTTEEFSQLQKYMHSELHADFTITNGGVPVTKEYIDFEMGSDDLSIDTYIDALIGYCTVTLSKELEESPFGRITNIDKEKLSLLTQFFLAEVNIYCSEKSISDRNFGLQLDKNPELSKIIASTVKDALEEGKSVEYSLIKILNDHSKEFGFSDVLSDKDISIIIHRYQKHYKTIESVEDPDEFMVADSITKGKVVTHQGSICTDFTYVLDAGFKSQKTPHFDAVVNDISKHNYVVPNSNDGVATELNISPKDFPDYLANLIANGNAKYALAIIKEKLELLEYMTPSSIDRIFASKDKLGNGILAYTVKESADDYTDLISILSAPQLIDNLKDKNKRGENIVHSVINRPQKLSLVLNSVPRNRLNELVQEKNAHNETLLQAARVDKSIQIISEMTEQIDSNYSVKATPSEPEKMRVSPVSSQDITPTSSGRTTPESSASSSPMTSKNSSPLSSGRSSPVSRSSITSSGMQFFKTTNQSPVPKSFANRTLAQDDSGVFKVYLNKSVEEAKAAGAKNCLVWQTSLGKELAYISSSGDVSVMAMKLAKAFTFKSNLQTLSKKHGVSGVDDICTLNLKEDEVVDILKNGGLDSQEVVSKMLSGSNSHDNLDM